MVNAIPKKKDLHLLEMGECLQALWITSAKNWPHTTLWNSLRLSI